MLVLTMTVEELKREINDAVSSALSKKALNQNDDDNTPKLAPVAAKYIGVSLATLYSMNMRGLIPSCKPPGTKRLLFYRKDLDAYLQKSRKKTISEIEAQATSFLK